MTLGDDFSLQKGTHRKLLTVNRQLMVNIKYLNNKLQTVKKLEVINITSHFNQIEFLFNEFKIELNNITDFELVSELGTADLYKKCCFLAISIRIEIVILTLK